MCSPSLPCFFLFLVFHSVLFLKNDQFTYRLVIFKIWGPPRIATCGFLGSPPSKWSELRRYNDLKKSVYCCNIYFCNLILLIYHACMWFILLNYTHYSLLITMSEATTFPNVWHRSGIHYLRMSYRPHPWIASKTILINSGRTNLFCIITKRRLCIEDGDGCIEDWRIIYFNCHSYVAVLA